MQLFSCRDFFEATILISQISILLCPLMFKLVINITDTREIYSDLIFFFFFFGFLWPDLPGFTRSVYRKDHALIAPESHVFSPLPEWYFRLCISIYRWNNVSSTGAVIYISLTGLIHWEHT